MRIDTEAKSDIQSETCDYTACNGFTFKVDIYDTVHTYGQCQYPAGKDGAKDDFFCFVNANSACEDKVNNKPIKWLQKFLQFLLLIKKSKKQ